MDSLAAITSPPSDGSSAADETTLSVAWVGARPRWLDLEGARAELAQVDLAFPSDARYSGDLVSRLSSIPDVFHLAGASLVDVSRLREALPGSAIVLDLSYETRKAKRRTLARQRGAAHLILVGSLLELRETRRHHPQLAARTTLLERPLDLDRHAPQRLLLKTMGPAFEAFRRARRLDDGPVVLFSGPYAKRGALDVAIAAMAKLRARAPGLRLVAIRDGEVDRRYLDRCRRQAERLGGGTFVEYAPDNDELPFWYAAAHVVCLPSRDGAGAEPARLAAAAGRPIVGTEVEPLLEYVIDGETGSLVPIDDVGALVDAVGSLLASEQESNRLGETARRRLERAASPSAAASRLRLLWGQVGRRRRELVGAVGRPA
jgi:glycosyltransferase involved in cell wall biosynthesis